jgi:hypothetical protein
MIVSKKGLDSKIGEESTGRDFQNKRNMYFYQGPKEINGQ